APGASLIGQRIFDAVGGYAPPPSFETLTRDAKRAGADIGSNSWGDDTQGRYDLSAMEFDELVRDADALTPGDQPYILEFSAAPSELNVQEGAAPAVTLGISQDPALFKRAYILYDGYNLVRSVSIQRRINSLSWSNGFVISQPEGTAQTWASYIEEINPAWLVQGENKIEFKSLSGTVNIRGLKLIIETDSGWNSVASVSAPEVYDGDTSNSYRIAASSTNPNIQINFERPVQPETIKLYISGPMNVKAGLQYQNGTTWQDVKTSYQIDFSALQPGWNEITVPAAVTTQALRLVFGTSSLRLKPGVQAGAINELRVCTSPAGPIPNTPRIVISYPRDGEYFGRTAYIQGFALPASNTAGAAQENIEEKIGEKIVVPSQSGGDHR
ncbi:MAG: hypothetical protein AAB262_05445, partial [Elusimicrobiota bacterium]